MSEWEETTLGAHLNRVRRKVVLEEGVAYPAVSVTKDGAGLGAKEPFVGGVTNYASLFRVAEGDVVVRTITAFESPAGVAHAKHAGAHVSGVFLTYEVADGALPGFFELFFQTPMFWDEMKNRATGTVLRRKTISDSAFCGIPVALPPFDEQRRIVDVMAAVDAQIEVLTGEVQRGWGVWRAMVAGLDDFSGALMLADGLDMIQAGKSPKGIERTPGPDERAVLKISAVGKARFVPSEVKTVARDIDLPETTRVRAGDVLLVRCNAVLDRVGVVCQVPQEPQNLYLCDKTLRLVANADRLLANYLAHAMAAPSVRDQIAKRTAGSDMRNIGQASLREISIPDPGVEKQGRIAAALDAVVASALDVETELARLRMFRSTLLTSLLRQEIEIPESYDSLMNEAS